MAIFNTLNMSPDAERALAQFGGISPQSIAAQDAARAAPPPPEFLGTQQPGVPGYGPLPNLRGTGGGGSSKIDPALYPYLQMGLQRAEQLFFGQPQPTFFPGQTYVSPSAQTEQALAQQEALATGAQPTLQAAQQAYQSSLGQIGQTAAGGFLQGNPYQQAMLAAATRPLTQQYGEQIVPGIASLFSRAGRYGSGAMERALGGATEAYGRALGDVSANIVGQDYARERGLQQQAQLSQAALAQAAPSFFQMGFLPSQALAQVGAAREQIAAQPLQEAIQRFQYSQQLPYQQLQGFLSSVYGTPMGQSVIPQQQTNRTLQNLGIAATIGGLIPEAGRQRAFDAVAGLF
jgi:hypothetical protein